MTTAPAPKPAPAPVVAIKTEVPAPVPEAPPAPVVDNSPMPTEWVIRGKTLHNVVVGQVYPDRVEISYDGGVGSPRLADLDPTLQRRFNYDPALADKTTADREAAREKAVRDYAASLPAQPAGQASSPAPVMAAAPATKLTPEQRDEVQRRMQLLQDDIAFMIHDQSKLMDDKRTLKANGATMSVGAYTQKIQDEKAELAQLQAEL